MKFLFLTYFLLSSFYLVAESQIKHRFVASDESGKQLIHVDEHNPENNWKVPLKTRDLQLIGNDELLVSSHHGYKIVSLKDGSVKKSFDSKDFKNVNSARRLKNGQTFLTGRGKSHPIIIQVLDKNDEIEKTILVDKALKDVRLMRVTAEETFFLGFAKKMYEINQEGQIIWQKEIPGGNHIYKAVRTKKGNKYIASGYGCEFYIYDKSDEVKKKYDGKVKGAKFYADFQILRNGHIVFVNWMGHGRKDSRKGVQLAEFDRNGEIVWTWHHPEMAGCLHGLLVLDGLNTKKMHNEQRGLLAPVR